MILIDGVASDTVNALDRGLNYGDGLFETITYRGGELEFLDCHLNRLMSGCAMLNIAFDSLPNLKDDIASLCQQAVSDSVVKVIITRGVGSRGYAPARGIKPTRIVSIHPYPDHVAHYTQQGIKARMCQHRLSENVGLAGIKHLNRLDQVVASNEWQDKAIKEGLMLDSSGYVVEGTMSNIFIVSAGQLITPKLDKSGIAGVIRSKIIMLAKTQGMPFKETLVCEQALRDAEEVLVCNSVMGIVPIIYITDYNLSYPIGDVTLKLQQLFHQLKRS